MITDQDIAKLTVVFATKEDLAKFATKEDLVKFATKDDLVKFATKEDLEEYNLSLAITFDQVFKRFDDIEADLAELKKIAMMVPVMYRTLINHGQRISSLESKNSLN